MGVEDTPQECVITFQDGKVIVKREKDTWDFLMFECPNPVLLKSIEFRDRW